MNRTNNPAPTPEQRRAAMEAYFQACDATRERIVLKNGDITYHQVPYTIAGLCVSLGITREEFTAVCAPGKSKQKKQRADEALRALLLEGATRVEQYTVERALLGELSASVCTLLLKGWGYGEEADHAAKPPADAQNSLHIILDDPKNYST